MKARGKEVVKYQHISGRFIIIPNHRGDIKNGTLAAIRRQFREITGREMPW